VILDIADVSKSYGALRPLRLQRLAVSAGESIALVGLEHGAAEVLVNLITGATLPDAGHVRIFGRATADIADSSDWLATVDRFGIVSDRAVLLDQLTVLQNLAMPFTLEIEPPSDEVRARAAVLACEVGLAMPTLDAAIRGVDEAVRTRVRLGRALALDPQVLLLEHATATLSRDSARVFGRDVRSIAAQRGIAIVAITADESFASAVAARVLKHNAATGALTEKRRGWF
jgi:ABC-type transporter Mla maintaining outer membrane lipid asymmetry ATPase subunit MlaF